LHTVIRKWFYLFIIVTAFLQLSLSPSVWAATFTHIYNAGEGSIALSSTKLPVIAVNATLRICSTPSCESAYILRNLDAGSDAQVYASIALTTADIPIVAYYTTTPTSALKIAICNNAICDNPTIQTVDGDLGFLGVGTAKYHSISIALDSNNIPIIAYWDVDDFDIKLARCNSLNCNAPIITTVDSGDVGASISLALTITGIPVISYYNSNGTIRLAHCNTIACNAPTFVTIDTVGTGGDHISQMKLTSGDIPVIAYYDSVNQNLKLAICNTLACNVPVIKTLVSEGDVGKYLSLDFDNANLPTIAYYHVSGVPSGTRLEVARCNNATTCDAPTFNIIANTNPGGIRLALADSTPFMLTNGQLYSAYNKMPILARNQALTITSTAPVVISNLYLFTTDADNAPPQTITYNILCPPQKGVLNSNGFTQNHINNSAITYRHTVAGNDSFEFTVSDGNEIIGPFTFQMNDSSSGLPPPTPVLPNAAPRHPLFTTRTPTLTWNRVSWAVGYQIQLDTDTDFSASRYIADFSADTFIYTTPRLCNNFTYYWRVAAKRDPLTADNWSTIQTFTVST
jgi:hypothetical protein